MQVLDENLKVNVLFLPWQLFVTVSLPSTCHVVFEQMAEQSQVLGCELLMVLSVLVLAVVQFGASLEWVEWLVGEGWKPSLVVMTVGEWSRRRGERDGCNELAALPEYNQHHRRQ